MEKDTEHKELKVKVYADRLSVSLRNQRFVQLANSTVIFFLVIAVIYQSVQGHVVVIGDNLVAQGEGSRTMNDPDIIEVRANGHAELLYSRMFTFDYNNYKAQKNKAIFLGDKSVEDVYAALVNANFYKNIVDNHYLVRSYLDSTAMAVSSGSPVLTCYGRMELTNNFFLETRRLDMELKMNNVSFIKDKNPFGYSIASLDLLSNELLSRKNLIESE